jgi:hypothetical protein
MAGHDAIDGGGVQISQDRQIGSSKKKKKETAKKDNHRGHRGAQRRMVGEQSDCGIPTSDS